MTNNISVSNMMIGGSGNTQNITQNFYSPECKKIKRTNRPGRNRDDAYLKNPELALLSDLARILVGSDMCVACSFDDRNKMLFISGNKFSHKDDASEPTEKEKMIEAIKIFNEKPDYEPFLKPIIDDLRTQLGNDFKKDDEQQKDLIRLFFRGIDPSNISKLLGTFINESNRKYLFKYVEGFERITQNEAFLNKLKTYKLKFVHNDNVGVHAEVRVMERLLDGYSTETIDHEMKDPITFQIGTNLKTCQHCHLIYDLIEKRFKPKINFARRTTHGKFYKFTKDEYVPEVISKFGLEQIYRDTIEKHKNKSKKKYLDSSNSTEFKKISPSDYKTVQIDNETKKTISEFVIRSNMLTSIVEGMDSDQFKNFITSKIVLDKLKKNQPESSDIIESITMLSKKTKSDSELKFD